MKKSISDHLIHNVIWEKLNNQISPHLLIYASRKLWNQVDIHNEIQDAIRESI